MVNIIYPMILFIFIFGAGMTYINETELYHFSMPDSGLGTQISDSQNTVMAMEETVKNPGLSLLEQAFILGRCVSGGLTAILTLGFLLQELGIPPGLVGWLLSPLGIVVVFWLVELWLGRPAE